MLLSTIREEFVFNCQCRKLSEKTVGNYKKQIGYLMSFLESEHAISDIEDVTPQYIRQFLMKMRKKGRTVNYFNDLLKAFKGYFRYAYEEGYTETLLTEKIQNAKGDKVIIRTFSEQELKRFINHFSGNDYLSIRNKTMMMLFIDAGIRLNELAVLTEEQIKFDYIIIKGKGNKEHVVSKSLLLSKWLLKYLAVRQAYFQYRVVPKNMFLSKNGQLLSSSAIDKIIKKAGNACDISQDVRVTMD